MRTLTLSLALVGCSDLSGRWSPKDPAGLTATTPTNGTTPTFPTGGTTPGVDTDVDGDTYRAQEWGGDDCNDLDASVNPGAEDATCDGIDQDCDGTDGNALTGARSASPCGGVDADSDGYMNVNGEGAVVDCLDTDPTVYPGATEVMDDGIDQDCDGADSVTPPVDNDADNDGFDSVASGGTDCIDTDSSINPGEIDILNDGIDQDCSGADATTGTDVDGDGYVALADAGTDCNDTDPTVHPDAVEIINDGIDQDCDGFDGGDEDCDGFVAILQGGTDCDDTDAAIRPDAIEIVDDGIDQDCSGADSVTLPVDPDSDSDGSPDSLDCDDVNPLRFPGNPEVTDDDVDNDCDLEVDECETGFRRVNTIFTAPAGSTINWMSLWILIDSEEVEGSNVLETPPADVTAAAISNVGTIAYDRCVPDDAPWSLNAEFVDLSGATHWMCEAATVTGLQVFANGVDISADISADIWDGVGACDAAF